MSAWLAWTEVWTTATGAHDVSEVEHERSEKSTEDEDGHTPICHADVANASIQSAVVGVTRVLPLPCAFSCTGEAAIGAQAVARAAPGTTAVPVQGATPVVAGVAAGAVEDRVPGSFPPSR